MVEQADVKLGKFVIGTGAPGAPTVRATLELPGENKVLGTGTLNQVVSPPFINFDSALHGTVYFTGGGKTEMLITLSGSAIPPLIGRPHITEMQIVIEGNFGTTGTATYTYIMGADFHTITNVPVKVTW